MQIYNRKERLVSDILELYNSLNTDGFLVIADVEKAFDSVNPSFLKLVLETLSFGKVFLKWIQILLTTQESCYKYRHHCELFSAIRIKSNQNNQQLNILDHFVNFLHRICRWHYVFYRKKDSVIKLLNTLYKLSSILNWNQINWNSILQEEVFYKGLKKGLCGLKCLI